MRRRVISLAVVGAVVGCSYDWTIGSEDVPDSLGPSTPSNPPPAGTDGGRDAGSSRDAGPNDAGPGNGECGPTCTCQDRNRCDFTCSTGRCDVTCRQRSNCTIRCLPGAQCNVTCEDDAECNMDCSTAGAQCSYVCEDDAECRGTCRASVCLLDCPRRCNVDCSGGALCTRL